MASVTTAMAASFKQEILAGGHCFNATVTTPCTTASTTAVTGATSLVGVSVGMAVTGTNFSAGSIVAAITSSTAFTLSLATSASSATTATFTADLFKMALLKTASTPVYDSALANYATVTTASDETSGTGYTAAGTLLTNVTAVLSGTSPSQQAVINFTPNPSWTSATFSTVGCLIYNTSSRMGATGTLNVGRNCGVFDFGGTQTVSVGTFTVVMPGASSGAAILRVA